MRDSNVIPFTHLLIIQHSRPSSAPVKESLTATGTQSTKVGILLRVVCDEA